jgi:hypothetical protein
MAPLKFPSNFRYKALFGYRFPTSPQELIVHELLPLEALNNLHVHFDPNVNSSSNIVTTKSIIKLEYEPNFLKHALMKHKYKLR